MTALWIARDVTLAAGAAGALAAGAVLTALPVLGAVLWSLQSHGLDKPSRLVARAAVLTSAAGGWTTGLVEAASRGQTAAWAVLWGAAAAVVIVLRRRREERGGSHPW